MTGFARRVRVCRSYTLVVSYLPTGECTHGDTGAIDLVSDGTDIIDGLPSDTLGALIIGCDFNSHLGRDAEKRGTCGARGLPTPTSGRGWLLEE